MSAMLINRKRVKAFALSMAEHRAHRFTRVSEAFLARCEGQLKSFIRDHVARLPSKGKTVM